MLLLLTVTMLVSSITYATPNQSASDNFTNTTNISEIVENNTNSNTIQNTTTAVVNNTGTSPQENQTSELTNNTQNSSSEDSSQTNTIQNYTAAASDGTYNNVHGLWLNVDDVNNVDVDELIRAGITDVFVKANRISYPTYQTVLTTIINKLQGTEIRIHAWITCFVDVNGNWVDPKDSNTTDALVKAITDITTNYDIAGIHLDYVRYPGTAYKYSGGTEAITSFVQRVYATVKSIKAKVAVSAALMPEGAVNAYYYGQDYAKLSNYLDFLVPMIYEGNYNEDNEWITTTTAYIVNHSTKPVVVGLQTYESDNNLVVLSAEEINADIESALSGGASGFTLFRYGWVDKDFFNSPVLDTTFTIDQIKASATVVRRYIEANGKLPNSVLIGSTQVTMPQFLELLVTATIQINNGNTNSILVRSSSAPTNPLEYIKSGNIYKDEYLAIAQSIKNYMDTTGKTPDYFYGTSLGSHMRYENLIYMYSTIMDYYNTNGGKAASVAVQQWNSIDPGTTANTTSNTTNTQTTYSIAEIIDASGRVKTFIENNHALPNYVQIGSMQVSMPQFLRLLTTCVLEVKDGITTPIVLKSSTTASNPYEVMTSGNLDKSEYLDLANRIKSFMDSNTMAPNYGSTTLGKIRYESLVYLFSRVMVFYGNERYLPNYATMKPWSSVIATDNSVPADLQQYLQATLNCQVNDPSIIAMAQSITSGATSSYDKAQRIFNWVRDNLEYSMYYDSQQGAVETLSYRSGNCCDHSHLIVALSRASGLPARYVHGVCTFSSGTYGHVWAQIYVNGQWYNADATSYRNSLGVINNWNTNSWTYKGTYTELPF